MSNANLIYFSMILDRLGTDEQLIHDEIPKDIPKYSNIDGFSRLKKRTW